MPLLNYLASEYLIEGKDRMQIDSHHIAPVTQRERYRWDQGFLWRILDKQFSFASGYTLMESPLIISESSGPSLVIQAR